MIEHIFRNINDIRVFDLLSEYLYPPCDGETATALEIDEIMEFLEYPEYKRIEVEDTVEHFIRNKILDIKKIKVNSWSGCRTCRWTDRLKFPRVGEHKQHKPYTTSELELDSYYMLKNEITQSLIAGAFAHVFLTAVPPENEYKLEEKC